MIADRIEQIVKDSNVSVSMTLGGIKFTCNVLFMRNDPVGFSWSYKPSKYNSVEKNARLLFEFMLQETCAHNNKKVNSSGGFTYAGGEVNDNIKEELFCLDCGKTLESEGG